MRSLEDAATAVDTIVNVPQRCSISLSLDGGATVHVCVCLCGATAISESFSLAARLLLLLLYLLLLLAAYIISNSNGCNLQPAAANTSCHRIGQPSGAPCAKKSRAKPKRKAANEGKSCHAPKWVKRATGRQTVQTARQTWTRTVAGDRGSNPQTAVGPRRRTLRIRNAHACV